LAPYLASLTFGFTFDDALTILSHRGVKQPFSVDDLFLRDFWGRSFVNTIGSYRPVATLTYWLDWHLGGGRPWIFHATNLALYAALLVLAERFLRRFFASALAAPTRLLIVGVFGALAIHTDVVPSATGRAEILAALFTLLALLAPLRETGGVRWRDALACSGASLLAMACKESALPVAVLAPLMAFRWHSGRGTAQRGRIDVLAAGNAFALVATIAFRVLRMPWMIPGPEGATANALFIAGPLARITGPASAFAHYLGHLFWPCRLAPDYGYAAIPVDHEPMVAAAGFVIAAAAITVAVATRRRPVGLTDAALAFAASYVAVSHVVLPAVVFVADRLFFLPSLWIITFAGLLAERAPRRLRVPFAGLAIAFAGAQAVVAARDSAHWRDDVTLFTSAVDAQPTAARSRRNLAQALADTGRLDDAAWQLIVSMALLTRFPAPVPAKDFPASWEAMPVPCRLLALRAESGQYTLFANMKEAQSMFLHLGYAGAAHVIEGWKAALPRCPSAR
ncbi:MAG: hypothetical protein ACREJ3_05730, partial [Polyangiaceae bacterium]